MKLMTKELERLIPAMGANQKLGVQYEDLMCRVKYFHPFSSWTLYGIEYDPVERVFFGLVIGFEKELGYFSLDELETVKVKGLGIERDRYYTPEKLSKVLERGY